MIRRLLSLIAAKPGLIISDNPAGTDRYYATSEKWYEGGQEFAVVDLAGYKMHLVRRQTEYALLYMGFQATGFETAAKAREAAPEFACAVFDLLKQRVVDFPPLELKRAQMDR